VSKVSVAEAIVDILDREGVRYVFGIPGGPILGLCDALERHPRVKMVLTRHEQGAAYAAYAHARASGGIGVCMSTLGPGATNLLAGLPVAATESAPVFAITGQVQTSGIGRGAHQESSGWFRTPDQNMMFRAVCKNSSLCIDAEHVPDHVRHSIRLALAGRAGPTHLTIPSGLLERTINYVPLSPNRYRPIDAAPVDDAAAARIAQRIAKARMPVLLLGGRAVQPSCGVEAERLSDLGGIPLSCDLACKSVVDESHPLYLGCIGVLGHRSAEKYLKETADLIVAVGQTFDEISTLGWDPRFFDDRDLVQLDVYGDEIGKAFPVVDSAIGVLPALLSRISVHLKDMPLNGRSERLDVVKDMLKRNPPFAEREMQSEKVPPLPQRVVADLQSGIPENALILSDSSKWARWLGRHFKAARGQIMSAHDYEPMGWAVAGALGAKLAQPNRPVICISGDGAFLMSAMELSTARNYGIDVIWMVMNDSRLGIIYDLQKSLYRGQIAGTTFENPDLCRFAESLGIEGRLVAEPGALTATLREVTERGGSFLLDVRFDPDEIPAIRPRSLLITKGMGLPDPTPGRETTRLFLKLLKER
jgi:acetolactate synthase-1/2/3 large subunit